MPNYQNKSVDFSNVTDTLIHWVTMQPQHKYSMTETDYWTMAAKLQLTNSKTQNATKNDQNIFTKQAMYTMLGFSNKRITPRHLWAHAGCQNSWWNAVMKSSIKSFFCTKIYHRQKNETRMVQLPATAAIEYVAACWVSGGWGWPGGLFPGRTFSPGVFCLGALLAGGIFVRGCFCPGGLCPFPPSSMRIRTV